MLPIDWSAVMEDMRAVARSLGTEGLTYRAYSAHGKIASADTITKHFGGWTKAVEAAMRGDAAPAPRTPAPYVTPSIVASPPPAPKAPIDPLQAADERDHSSRLRRENSDLIDRLREERKRNEFLRSLRGVSHTPTIIQSERASGIREMTAVVLGSDWHVEETVEPEKVAGRNEYNLTIADHRIQRFFRGAVDVVEHHRASGRIVVRDMVLALMGDLMSGYIHEELAEENALSPIETSIWLRPRIENGIKTLLERLQLRTLVIPWSYGNHGRTTRKPRIATGAENSFEWLLGRTIQESFAGDPRVKWDISPSFHQYVQVYDYTLHFHHGDSLNYQGGVGGLGIPLLKAVPAWDDLRFSHYHHVGHWHTLRDYGRALVNGSLVGYGPYSAWIRAAFERPQQLAYLLDSKRGKCMSTPIWVDEEAAA